jgi:hypothetical protein
LPNCRSAMLHRLSAGRESCTVYVLPGSAFWLLAAAAWSGVEGCAVCCGRREAGGGRQEA